MSFRAKAFGCPSCRACCLSGGLQSTGWAVILTGLVTGCWGVTEMGKE